MSHLFLVQLYSGLRCSDRIVIAPKTLKRASTQGQRAHQSLNVDIPPLVVVFEIVQRRHPRVHFGGVNLAFCR